MMATEWILIVHILNTLNFLHPPHLDKGVDTNKNSWMIPGHFGINLYPFPLVLTSWIILSFARKNTVALAWRLLLGPEM